MYAHPRTVRWTSAICLGLALSACTSSKPSASAEGTDSGPYTGVDAASATNENADDSSASEVPDANGTGVDGGLDGTYADSGGGDGSAAEPDAAACWKLRPNGAPDVFLDLGVGGAVAALRQTEDRLLVVDERGWVLRNTETLATVAEGLSTRLYDRPGGAALGDSLEHPFGLALVDLRADTLAVEGPGGAVEIRDATSGGVVRTIQADALSLPNSARAALSVDGSYFWVASTNSFEVWSTRSSEHVVLAQGNYFSGTARVFAAPGEIRIAAGPAGANVIQTVDPHSGQSLTSPAFSGSFVAWFEDGESFATRTGNSVWVYPRTSGTSKRLFSLTDADLVGGYGDYLWSTTSTANQLRVYSIGATGSAPVLVDSVSTTRFASGPLIGVTNTTSDGAALSVVDLRSTTPALRAVSGANQAPLERFFSSPSSAFSVADRAGVVWTFSDARGTDVRSVGCGKVTGMAGSHAGTVAVATAAGVLIARTGDHESVLSTLPFRTNHLELSDDGTLLALSSGLHSVSVVSIPGGDVLNQWDDAERVNEFETPG